MTTSPSKRLEKSTEYEINYEDIQLHAVNGDCGIVGIRLTRNGRSDSEMIHLSSAIMKHLKDYVKIVDGIEVYARILLDGDPDAENPKKILDTIWEIIETKNKEVTAQ